MKKGKKLFLFGAICALSLCCALPTYAKYEYELREAAKDGNIEYVKKYVQNGAYVDDKDYEGKTALYFAVQYNNFNIVKYLIEEAKANPNVGGKHCPLSVAWGTSWHKIYKYLCEHGATIENPLSQAYSALVDRDYWLVNCIIDHSSLDREKFINDNVPYVCKMNEKTPNCQKYIFGLDNPNFFKEDEICELLDIGLLNPKNNDFYTWAFSKNYSNVMKKMKELSNNEVKLDFEHCADDIKNKIINSALSNCKLKTLNLLIEDGATTPLELWSRLCDNNRIFLHSDDESYNKNICRTILFLINKGVDINHKAPCDDDSPSYYETILSTAISERNITVVRFLLNHGADIYSECIKSCFWGKIKSFNALSYAKYWYKEESDKYYRERYKYIYLTIKEFSKSHPDPNAKPKKSVFSKLFG